MFDHQPDHSDINTTPWYRTRAGLALAGFAVLSALLLVYEHRLHFPFGNLLVVLPLFACFGLHAFMHGGHGGHGRHHHSGTTPKSPDQSKTTGEEDQP